MDFATLPPETNSARMYSGPGSGSLRDAAIAWDALSARLRRAAAQYGAVMAPTQAVAAYVRWLQVLAEHAEQTAARARGAASAYELALAAMVHPSAIAANRRLRTWLAEANQLAQETPAIADADADYDQMWAQDAATMYAYAAACAEVLTETPFPPPPGTDVTPDDPPASWELASAPEVIATGGTVISAICDTLTALPTSPPTAFASSLAPVTVPLSKLGSLCGHSDFAINRLSYLNKQATLHNAAALLTLLPNRAPTANAASGLGRAISIGALSVPRAWTVGATRAAAWPSATEWPSTVDVVDVVNVVNLVSAGTRHRFAQSRHTNSRHRRSP